MDNIRTDTPFVPSFTTGLMKLAESGKYEGKENIALPYYRQSKKKKSEDEESEKKQRNNGDHQIDVVA